MRSFFFTITIVFASIAAAFGQATPPPPALIYAPPTVTEIQSFTSADKSFSVAFPGKPEVEEKMMGNAKVSSFRVYRKGSNSVIGITDFLRDISANSERAFKMVRERMLAKGDAKLISEKDVTVDGYAGKEFVTDSGSTHRVSRVFVVRERIYEIYVDAVNWDILTKDLPNVVAAFEKETARFFASFHLTQPKQ